MPLKKGTLQKDFMATPISRVCNVVPLISVSELLGCRRVRFSSFSPQPWGKSYQIAAPNEDTAIAIGWQPHRDTRLLELAI